MMQSRASKSSRSSWLSVDSMLLTTLRQNTMAWLPLAATAGARSGALSSVRRVETQVEPL